MPGRRFTIGARLARSSVAALAIGAFAGLCGLPSAGASTGASTALSAPTPGTVVIRFASTSTPTERADALAEAGLSVVDHVAGSDFVEAEDSPGSPSAPLDEQDVIVDARPPVRMQAAASAPNDPGFPMQWHLAAVQVPAVWDLTRGQGVIVAVLDTGVAYETAGAFRQAPDLAGTTFVPGYDFVAGDSHPNDENGHGTHVAGTIAQTTGNDIGVAGVAPGASIMPLRVLDAAGGGSDVDVAAALRWAADHGAQVANLSFGGPLGSPVLTDAVAYATGKGVTVVAAGGNAAGNEIMYPAAYPDVVAVGAVRLDKTRAPYSNTGTALDLMGPGGDLTVDQNSDSYRDGVLQEAIGADGEFCYCFLQGTSMASPHVAAVAALVVSRGLTAPAAVHSVLRASALDLGATGRDDIHGAGLVQALAAVREADERVGAAVPPPVAPPVTEEPAPEEPVTEEPPTDALTIDTACPSDRMPAGAFNDVGADDTHGRAIDCMAWWGVAAGTSATTYSPGGPVSRGQMASLVARAVEAAGPALPEPTGDFFDDDAGSVHERRINQLAAAGIVAGSGPRSFQPGAPVTRAQMATFLVRAHDLVGLAPLRSGPDRFSDDQGDPHEANVNAAAAAGIAAGTGLGLFSPGLPVSRAQVASFLARTLELLVRDGTAAAP